MLSVKQVADMFLVTPQTIYSWVYNGILNVSYTTPTGRRFFSEEEVQRVKESR